jgi:hypothetical protein
MSKMIDQKLDFYAYSLKTTMKIIYVYILVLNILIGHQIDASYWHEWEMFQLSGGVELFDCFNLIIFPPFLFGLIYANQPSRFLPFAVSLGLMGFITTLIHIGFYSLGYKQFHLPISASLIAGAGIGGFYLLSLAISRRHL